MGLRAFNFIRKGQLAFLPNFICIEVMCITGIFFFLTISYQITVLYIKNSFRLVTIIFLNILSLQLKQLKSELVLNSKKDTPFIPIVNYIEILIRF